MNVRYINVSTINRGRVDCDYKLIKLRGWKIRKVGCFALLIRIFAIQKYRLNFGTSIKIFI